LSSMPPAESVVRHEPACPSSGPGRRRLHPAGRCPPTPARRSRKIRHLVNCLAMTASRHLTGAQQVELSRSETGRPGRCCSAHLHSIRLCDARYRTRRVTHDEALVAGDPVALDRLYADDFEYIGPGAIVRNKQQPIASFASAAIDLLEGKSDEVSIRLYGGTAVLTGHFKGRVRAQGREYNFSERYSTVCVRDRGDWKIVLEHGTVIRDP